MCSEVPAAARHSLVRSTLREATRRRGRKISAGNVTPIGLVVCVPAQSRQSFKISSLVSSSLKCVDAFTSLMSVSSVIAMTS